MVLFWLFDPREDLIELSFEGLAELSGLAAGVLDLLLPLFTSLLPESDLGVSALLCIEDLVDPLTLELSLLTSLPGALISPLYTLDLSAPPLLLGVTPEAVLIPASGVLPEGSEIPPPEISLRGEASIPLVDELTEPALLEL